MVDETEVLMGEAIVILAPDMRGEQIVERSDLAPPRQVACNLQPLCMLVEPRIDDVDERFVAIEYPMPPGQQIALKPAFALVLAQHRVEHAPGGCKKLVSRQGLGVPLAVGRFKNGFETIRERFVRAKNPEVALLLVKLRHIAQEPPEHIDRKSPRLNSSH